MSLEDSMMDMYNEVQKKDFRISLMHNLKKCELKISMLIKLLMKSGIMR